MIKFLMIAGLFFVIAVGFLIGTYVLLFVGLRCDEFFDKIEKMYGFRTSVIAFLISLALVSAIVAAGLTIAGV